MKVCIFGAGAIGGFVGASLAAVPDVDVSLVARGAHLAAMRDAGLRLLIDGQERVARVRCTDHPAELPPQDYVIVALKAHAITEAVDAIVPLLGPDTSIVTMSNGIPYWYFHDRGGPLAGTILQTIDPDARQWRQLGPERAIGAVVFPAAEVVAPGVVRHEYGRKIPLGEPSGQRTERIVRLQAMLEAGGLEAPIRDDIRDEIWLKLWGNLCFNPVSALTHATVDVIATDPGTLAVCRSMMTEAAAIAERLSVQLRVDMERRIAGAAAIGPHKMSMLQDLERGRSMEIDPLVGVVQELGRLTGVATPAIDIVLALIRQRARSAATESAPKRTNGGRPCRPF
ncbi:MAG TPA: 2-dehydropantoate 2-reductase [Casimicrobiaceae bacterium]